MPNKTSTPVSYVPLSIYYYGMFLFVYFGFFNSKLEYTIETNSNKKLSPASLLGRLFVCLFQLN